MSRKLQKIKIADIKVGKRKRPVGNFDALKKSIQNVGLLTPITVRAYDMTLIAGLHRLEAFKALGKDTITAYIVDADSIKAELEEIEENVIRNELTELEKAEQLKRQKELYELLKQASGANDNVDEKSKKRNSCVSDKDSTSKGSITKEISEKTGKSVRSVQQGMQIAEKITPEAKAKIKGTPLENQKRNLIRIAQTTPEKQLDVVEKELEKLNKPKRVKAESNAKKAPVQITLMQAEPVNATDSQSLEKELDVVYKVDFVLRKIVVDGKWLNLPPEYNMDNNSYNNMMLVAKNYLTTKGKKFI